MPLKKNWPDLARIIILLGLLALASLTACSQQKNEPVYRTQIFAFGTLVELSLFGVDEQKSERLSSEIRVMMEDFHQRWHAWQTGPLTQLNAALAQHSHADVDEEQARLLAQALQLAKASNGLFHPALGDLISLWGFHNDELPQSPPNGTDIQKTLGNIPKIGEISVNTDTISTARPETTHFDLGGFAKGVIVDRTIEWLRQQGIENAIVNAGGDLRAIGAAGKRPWRIGIRHPRDSGVFASLTIEGDEAIFTSGDYERYFDYAGKRYHHILDPRTGYPADSIASVTVVHSDGATADAAATALFIAGPKQWRQTARAMGIEHVMIIDRHNKVYITPALAKRMEYESSPAPSIEIQELP